METEKLTKVQVELPSRWAGSGESLWARALDGNQYELRNVPFHAYGLNFLDVVEAAPATKPDGEPAVKRVVRRSGHRTLRVIFQKKTAPEQRFDLLDSLAALGVTYEQGPDPMFAIDVSPSGKYPEVCAQLAEWEKAGLLEYETCELRALGTFDEKR